MIPFVADHASSFRARTRGMAFALHLLVGCNADPSPRLSLGDDREEGLGSDAGVIGPSLPDGSGPANSLDAGTITGAPIDPAKCGAVTKMAMNMLQPVDIILGVDTTGSMAEEIGFTEENMNAFSQQISAAGIDVRVILIATPQGAEVPLIEAGGVCIAAPLGSGNCPNDANPPRYVHVPTSLADWDMLQTYIDQYSMYKQYLRTNSFKSFVSISDGDIGANPVFQQPLHDADTFIAAVEGLEPKSTMWKDWRYSGIYSFSACGIGNDPGVVHADLVKRTKGVGGDLCEQNFKPVFDSLAKQVMEVVRLSCNWEIPAPPSAQTFDPMKTNIQLSLDGKLEQLAQARSAAECGAREGWYYDDPAKPKQVLACPATCTRIQSALNAKVDLLFGCQTVVLL